jgi:vacuolar-type H+-ATPase subunit I/STV1
MFYAIIDLIVLVSIGIALYCFLQKSDLDREIASLRHAIEDLSAGHADEVRGLRSELAKLDRLSHIPGVLERAKNTEQEIAAKLEEARRKADEIVLNASIEAERQQREIAATLEQARMSARQVIELATKEAESLRERIVSATEIDSTKAKEARRVAEWQANNILEEAQKKAKEIASQARKEPKEKIQKVEETLSVATAYALEIRSKADKRAHEIGGTAYEALTRHDFYRAAAQAMQNVVSGYGGIYMVPSEHILDELAEDYGFDQAGERLKIARDRTKVMEKNGSAAACNYPEGWKRDYAVNFVLGAFNGKVDSILARVKPANKGKLIQEIKMFSRWSTTTGKFSEMREFRKNTLTQGWKNSNGPSPFND